MRLLSHPYHTADPSVRRFHPISCLTRPQRRGPVVVTADTIKSADKDQSGATISDRPAHLAGIMIPLITHWRTPSGRPIHILLTGEAY